MVVPTGNLTGLYQNYIVRGPKIPIFNLQNHLNCFSRLGQINPGHRYRNKVTLYVDQPVDNTNELFRLFNDERMVGHTYIGLEQTDLTVGSTINPLKFWLWGEYILKPQYRLPYKRQDPATE